MLRWMLLWLSQSVNLVIHLQQGCLWPDISFVGADNCPRFLVTGTGGTGKSVWLVHLMREAARRHLPVVLVQQQSPIFWVFERCVLISRASPASASGHLLLGLYLQQGHLVLLRPQCLSCLCPTSSCA